MMLRFIGESSASTWAASDAGMYRFDRTIASVILSVLDQYLMEPATCVAMLASLATRSPAEESSVVVALLSEAGLQIGRSCYSSVLQKLRRGS